MGNIKRFCQKGIIVVLFLSVLSICFAGSGKFSVAEISDINKITNLKGKLNKSQNVYTISSPRTDVKVTVNHWGLSPYLGLTTWVGFAKNPDDDIMLMGDMVLFQDEVNPVMSVALNNGLQVTALHNHFFFDTPRAYFMHIGGMGSAEKLATGIDKIFAKIKDIRAVTPIPVDAPSSSVVIGTNSINQKIIEDILGIKGQKQDGMYKVSYGRRTNMHGIEADKDLGVMTWAGFGGSNAQAFIDGDFAVYEDELQPVLKAVRDANLQVVSIHNHMTHEDPRVIFFHFWGVGPLNQLVRGFKSAIDMQEIAMEQNMQKH